MNDALAVLSEWMLPLVVAVILAVGAWRRVPVYETFIEGAQGGFTTSIRLIPHLVAMMVAVSVFRASGAMDGLIHLVDPILTWLHVPAAVAPMGILRPITGQGSLAFMIDIFQKHGPDSHLGLLASTMQASSDTTLYILTVYFGSVGIYRFRYALAVGLLSDFVSVLASVFAVWLVSGMIHV
ncbi:spore maturation protein [Alicyclobacillus vulcanalis]|uniref:Spore maturation protein B n=1 Tax=Alicyclobacillus vulcanalis TaxID=252246 RepID=A0A1N7KL88_9BACL|nr:nucleoside recognition domain-containing protein [Alicyclobacillus vulcanalis]SIS62200.1 spore maturation protein B [Alicyclobacillus vulcanalis]